VNKFTLDTDFYTFPTLVIGDRSLTVKVSEEQAQELVDWLNVALDAERDELVRQRDALVKACGNAASFMEYVARHRGSIHPDAQPIKVCRDTLALVRGDGDE